MSLHVVPVNDLIEHQTDEDCPCGPTPELVQRFGEPDRWVIVHHSLDGRELTETRPNP